MSINFVFAVVASVVLMVLWPAILLVFVKNKKHLQTAVKLLSIVYFCFLAIGVLGKIDLSNGNFSVTFETTNKWLDFNKFTVYSFGTFNVLINLYMLLPVGAIGYACFDEHKFAKTIALSFFISLFIETLQLILPVARSVELTDLLYNTLSGIIGYCLFALISKFQKHKTVAKI